MIELDGSHGEGGGSIIRVATALSVVTGKPCKITNIRAGRLNPGLRAQHMESINALSELCNAKIKGNDISSTEVEFHPGKELQKRIVIEIPTAGSIGLALQSILIAATKTSHAIDIVVKGGATNGKWAAPVNYIKNVLLPLLEKMEYNIDLEIIKYGYYPKGGAQVVGKIHKSNLSPLVLENKGNLLEIKGISHASKELEKAEVAERQKKSAMKILYEKTGISPKIEIKYVETLNPGSSLDLWTITDHSVLGADGLGEKGKKAEVVGKEAAEHIVNQIKSDAAVDEHAEDQLLAYMAIATEKGPSIITVPKLTEHTKTNIWVIEKFLPIKFQIIDNTIKCSKI